MDMRGNAEAKALKTEKPDSQAQSNGR